MQDLKSLGDKSEVSLGNKEVAFLVGALFVVMVVVFGLGVMVGKRLYGPVPARKGMEKSAPVKATEQKEPEPEKKQPVQPEPAKSTEAPEPEQEDLTFYKMKEKEQSPEKPEPKKTSPPEPEKKEPKKPAPEPSPPPKPEAKKPTTPSPPGEEKGWKFSIQVGAMVKKANAEGYVKRLKNAGWDAWVNTVEPKDPDGNTVHQVRVGKYMSRDEAATELEAIKKTGLVPQGSFIRTRK